MASRRTSLAAVDPVDARGVVETFFDALGHFAGEGPGLDDLARVLAPSAHILELEEEARGEKIVETSFYVRDAWLTRLAQSAKQRREAGQGHFFEEVERTVTERERELCFGSVVEERVTVEGEIAHVETLRCSLVVGQVGDSAAIVEVRVRRSSRPASG